MTTNVQILNAGPHPVRVSVLADTPEGPKENELQVIQPGAFTSPHLAYVFTGQSLRIDEVKEPQPAVSNG